MQGAVLNDTSSVTFVNVKVPVENLIGTKISKLKKKKPFFHPKILFYFGFGF